VLPLYINNFEILYNR